MLIIMSVLVIVYFVYLAWLISWEMRIGYREPLRLVVQVRDQEQGVEGLIWRLVRTSRCCRRILEVVVVDCGSRDDTTAILARMPLPCGVPLAGQSGSGTGLIVFDARGLTGRQLLEDPVRYALVNYTGHIYGRDRVEK